MKKRLVCTLLALTLLLSLAACSQEEASPSTTAEKEMTTAEKAAKDEAALEKFIKEYREGVYKEEELFSYEDLSEYYELGEYKGLTYPDDPAIREEVTDEEVERYQTFILISNTVPDSDYTAVPEGQPLQEFDVVTMDYTGIIDGKEHDNAKDTDATLMLGSGQFIDGFESGLVGKTVGSTVQLELKFSPYYSDPQVAGKSATFTVKIKSAQRPKIPEATVEVFGKIAGKAFSDLEGVRQDIRSYLEGKKAESAYTSLATYLQGQLLDRGKAKSYPEKELEIYRKRYIDDCTQGAESGMTLEEFCEKNLGISYEEFNADAVEYAQISTAASMMVLAVAQKEGITCTDEQMEAVIRQLYANLSQYFSDMESFLAYHRQAFGADYFEDWVINAAVSERLVEYAVKVS